MKRVAMGRRNAAPSRRVGQFVVTLFLVGCAGAPPPVAGPPASGAPGAAAGAAGPAVASPTPAGDPLASKLGFSGMAAIAADQYLVVHDVKAGREGARLGLIEVVAGEGLRYHPVAVADWRHAEGPANDLESACPLDGRPGEVLVAESGYRKGRFGRLFHLRVDPAAASAAVLGVYALPVYRGRAASAAGEAASGPLAVLEAAALEVELEGLACVRETTGGYRLVLGERGSSTLDRPATLRFGRFAPERAELAWDSVGGEDAVVVRPPAPVSGAPADSWPGGADRRDVADLYFDAAGLLWTVATADPGDAGPFRSVIYPLGRLGDESSEAFVPATGSREVWVLDGVKVEALGPPAAAIAGSALVVASDDEAFPGVWRPLFAPGNGLARELAASGVTSAEASGAP